MLADTSRLDGSRVFLTELNFANIWTHFRWNNDAELHALEYDTPFVPESFGDFFRRFEMIRRNGRAQGFDFEIHRRGYNDSLIGVASLSNIDPANHHAGLTLTIGAREAWHQGYGRETLDMLLRFSFDTLGLHRVMTTALTYNAAWKHLLTTSGFQREGCLREHVYRHDCYWDKESYALLAHEYYAHRALAA